jgi:hypothetical protein
MALAVPVISRMIARAGKAAGLPFLIHSHVLRHSTASNRRMPGGTPSTQGLSQAPADCLDGAATRRRRRIDSRGSGNARGGTRARLPADAAAVGH